MKLGPIGRIDSEFPYKSNGRTATFRTSLLLSALPSELSSGIVCPAIFEIVSVILEVIGVEFTKAATETALCPRVAAYSVRDVSRSFRGRW